MNIDITPEQVEMLIKTIEEGLTERPVSSAKEDLLQIRAELQDAYDTEAERYWLEVWSGA